MKANARQYAESLAVAQAAGERSTKELVSGLMSILKKKRSSHLAKKILSHLLETEAEKKGTAEVVIETAHTVEAATKKVLLSKAEKLYPGKKVEASFQINPELGSGFRIRGKGRELDQSFSVQLKKLRNQLTHL